MRLGLAGAAGFFAGVLLVIILGAANGDRTRTVTVQAGGSGSGRVIVRATVPQVTGVPLDEAHDRIERAGFDMSIDAGGGLLGPLFEDNWVVVDQEPPAGTKRRPGSTVHVAIERG